MCSVCWLRHIRTIKAMCHSVVYLLWQCLDFERVCATHTHIGWCDVELSKSNTFFSFCASHSSFCTVVDCKLCSQTTILFRGYVWLQKQSNRIVKLLIFFLALFNVIRVLPFLHLYTNNFASATTETFACFNSVFPTELCCLFGECARLWLHFCSAKGS